MEKQRWEESGRRRDEVRRSERRKSEKKEEAGARKGRKSRFTAFCPMICGPTGSKSNLAKAAGAEPAGQMKDKMCTPLLREAHVKMLKTPHDRTTFGRPDLEKVHAVVARSTFLKQSVKNN